MARPVQIAFIFAAVLLGFAFAEAAFVLFFLSRAIALRGYQRIGPETALRARMSEILASYDGDIAPDEQDKELVKDIRQTLLDSYTTVTAANRNVNERRYKLRARASLHLVQSLIWALGATTVIFVSDKVGYLP